MNVTDMAIYGAQPIFLESKPNSGLYRPSFENFLNYSTKIFSHRQLTNNGSLVRELEERLSRQHGVEHCIACSSGFMALVLSIKALAINGRGYVIMPSATYRKMTDIVRWAGFSPYYVDIDAHTLGVTKELVSPYITAQTALVLAAHPVVNFCDVEGLEGLCTEQGIPLLVDSVEAAFGEIDGRKIGSFGQAEVFSVHASKFINGFEGGYVTTNDINLASRLRRMRAFGFQGKDNIVELGCNAKLNEIHAAMALSCIDEITENIEHNKQVYTSYQQGLMNLPLELLAYDSRNVTTWRNIVVRLEPDWPFSLEHTLQLLNSENMLSRGYYTPLLHEDGKGPSFPSAPLPNSINASRSHIILPSGAHVSTQDAMTISKFLHFIYTNSDAINRKLKGDL